MPRSSIASLAVVSSMSLSLALALVGCPPSASTEDAGSSGDDAGPAEDAPRMASCPRMVPMPDQQMLPCCYRYSQASQLDRPEMRLRFLQIEEPSRSPIATPAVESVLNVALQNETFNWLFRTTGADDDGPITITTGYGVRNEDGTYTLGSAMYPPLMLPGRIMGERVTTDTVLGPLAIPVFDESGTVLQLVLQLRSVRVIEANLSEMRSCIGTRRGNSFTTDASLEGFITVEDARAGMINVPPIVTTLCSAIAGELTTPMGMMPLCERPRSEWMAPPDSLCPESGGACRANPAGSTSVCDPLTTCNAWRFLAQFAAVGVDIRD